MAKVSILIVDDEKNILTTLSRMLRLEGYEAQAAGSGERALELVASHPPDLIMLDVRMPEMDGLEVLRTLRERGVDVPVIVMSGHGTIETAVQATKLGAHDFIEKPLSSDKILITIQNVLGYDRLRRENADLKRQFLERYRLVGQGPRMEALVERIRMVSPTSGRVLITGENGTGKELVAYSIHENSKRAEGPFIKVNCAAVPKELVESELFGHERGSFTGAHRSRKGKFELAHRGTLFLDEIGDMELTMQAKLLRVLQEGEFERVGGVETIRVDVRVVAATNKDLAREIEEGRFRQDLFYRLNVVPMDVPPLRDRREDIPPLVDHFLDQVCEVNGQRRKTITEGAVRLLGGRDYPGNVRELRNTVERLVILTPGTTIDEGAVGLVLGQEDGPSVSRGEYVPGLPLKELVSDAERRIILAALAHHQDNVSTTAQVLQVERSHLYKKMKALGIR